MKLFSTYFVESKQAGQKFSTPFHISIPEITFSQTSAATNFKSFLLRMEISACFLARFFSFLFFLLDILGSRNRVLETKDTRNMREILHMTEQSCRMLAKRL